MRNTSAAETYKYQREKQVEIPHAAHHLWPIKSTQKSKFVWKP